jgi:UDP-N-acetylglucosamine 2-epimerase
MKVISIAGARPQFVKVAVVSHAVPKVAADLAIEHKLIHTGQHYDGG